NALTRSHSLSLPCPAGAKALDGAASGRVMVRPASPRHRVGGVGDGLGGAHPNPLLRRCREEMGWSQEHTAVELRRLAEADEGRSAGVTGNMICKWEKGEKKPSLRYQRLLRVLFGRTAAELGFGSDDERPAPAGPPPYVNQYDPPSEPLLPSGTDVERRAFLRLMAAASGAAMMPTLAGQPWERLSAALRRSAHVDGALVDDMVHRTAGFYGLEERVPARSLLPGVVRQVGNLTQLLEASPPSAFRRQLISTAGEAAALAGWLCFDSNDHAAARAYYNVAVEAAREADDQALSGPVGVRTRLSELSPQSRE
ncbi:MAG TPA: helix-turn-helix transcriptional regulator, partial [Frankiaceae bacterium]|nr:helix-turn-helix transcriptional regulator [Frankiaceae bacterium]